ncbi:MAG: hypothetical protein C0395_04765 [Gemmatimonas sp.]|nr:hypothetical protein [Gemmatimonas sp.]
MRGAFCHLFVVRARTAAAAAVLLPCLLSAVPAVGSDTAPDPAGRTCILLFMAGAGYGSGVADLADLRALGEQECSAALAHNGAAPLPAETSQALQRRWRIRDGRQFPPAFLADLDSAGTGRLLLVHLYLGSDRIELAGRIIDAGTGLTAAASSETCTLGGTAWRIDFALACRRLVATLAAADPARTGAPVAPLAVHPVGFDAATAQIATQCLVEAALADSACAVVDPAVLGGVLVAGGADPRRLDRPGLELLAGAFEVSDVIVVQMITRDPDQAVLTAVDDDGPSSRTVAWETVAPFSLHLRVVDTGTGLVSTACGVDQDNAPARGWFGNIVSSTPRRLIAGATHRLWDDSRRPGKVR